MLTAVLTCGAQLLILAENWALTLWRTGIDNSELRLWLDMNLCQILICKGVLYGFIHRHGSEELIGNTLRMDCLNVIFLMTRPNTIARYGRHRNKVRALRVVISIKHLSWLASSRFELIWWKLLKMIIGRWLDFFYFINFLTRLDLSMWYLFLRHVYWSVFHFVNFKIECLFNII